MPAPPPPVARRLLLVLLLSLLPLLAYEMVAAEATRHATLDWLERELHDAARQAAVREAATLGQAAELLDAVAAAPAMPADGLCAALQARLAGGPAAVAALAVHGADASPACTLVTGAGGAIGTGHVRAALAAAGGLTLTADPAAGLVLARRVVVAGGGEAVLALALAPSHLSPLALPLRRDLAVRRLVDPDDGAVLATQSGPGVLAGASAGVLQAPRLLAPLRAGAPDGVVLLRDLDPADPGARWLVGHAMLPLKAVRAAMLVELPYEPLVAEADARRRDQWLAALAMALLGAGAAWLLARVGSRAAVPVPVPVPARVAGGPPAQDQALAALRPAGDWLRHQGDLAAVTEAAGEMFLRLDARLRVVYASPTTRRVLGYAPAEMVDADLAAEPGWQACHAQLEALRRDEARPAPCRILARRRDDGEVWLEIRASRLADGGFMLACRDVGAEQAMQAELEQARARLATLAMADPVSGLANRPRFDSALAEETRRGRRAQEPVSLVLLRLIDWPGHVARHGAADADAAIRRVARLLTAMLRRPGDLAARLDDDLFAVLLPTTDRIGVQRMAERLQESLAAEWADVPADAVEGRIGACSMLPIAEEDGPDAVMALASQALHEATGNQGGLALAPAVVPARIETARASLTS